MKLSIGDKAPDFILPSTSGESFTLSEELQKRGKPVILFFYPGDFSTLCTREAIAFRDEMDQLEEQSADVVGISTNNMKSHRRFRKKFQLPFELLSDPAGKVCRMYDAYRPVLRQARRITFVINPDRTIRSICNGQFRVFRHVEHAIREICKLPKADPVRVKITV